MNGNFGGIDKGKLLDMLNSGGNKKSQSGVGVGGFAEGVGKS